MTRRVWAAAVAVISVAVVVVFVRASRTGAAVAVSAGGVPGGRGNVSQNFGSPSAVLVDRWADGGTGWQLANTTPFTGYMRVALDGWVCHSKCEIWRGRCDGVGRERHRGRLLHHPVARGGRDAPR